METPSFWGIIAYTMSLILFIVATVSDYLDGYYARKLNLSSNFGKLFDPLADKILTSSLLILFTYFKMISPYIVIIVLTREFAISGLRSLSALNRTALAANRWGKHKTGWQIAMIICLQLEVIHKELIHFGIPELVYEYLSYFFSFAHYFILVVMLFLTIYSSYIYFRMNWNLIQLGEEKS